MYLVSNRSYAVKTKHSLGIRLQISFLYYGFHYIVWYFNFMFQLNTLGKKTSKY